MVRSANTNSSSAVQDTQIASSAIPSIATGLPQTDEEAGVCLRLELIGGGGGKLKSARLSS